MIRREKGVTRRRFLQGSAAGVAALTIVPRNVLGQGQPAPSEEFGGALIGCGGRGPGTFNDLKGRHKLNVRLLARCDVRFRNQADNKEIYTDYRRVLERKDIDIVAIGTHPGWHALVSIAAMEAGKDCLVLAEKLAAAGKKDVAAKIYTHLRNTRTDPSEKYIRDAAEKALSAA